MPKIIKGAIYRVANNDGDILGEYDNQDEAQKHIDELSEEQRLKDISKAFETIQCISCELDNINLGVNNDHLIRSIGSMRAELNGLEILLTQGKGK